MKVKRFYLPAASVVTVLSLLLLAGCCYEPHVSDQLQDTSPENEQLITSDNAYAQQNTVQQITSRKAKEIAVDFIGYGIVHDIQAFMNDGDLIFEVDVRNDNMQYVVLLNAESGNVKGLNRHRHEHTIADISQSSDYLRDNFDSNFDSQDDCTLQIANEPIRQAEQQTEQQAPQASATPAPAASPQSTPRPSTSSSTGGQASSSSGSTISLNRAIEIANADLRSRGISATYRSNSGIDWERGQRVWELLYTTHGERMPLIEYYINAENGSIVKFEWDD